MEKINIEQNTDNWLDGRKKVIGASDCPSIMGVSKWRTILQLYEEKKGICTPDQAAKAFIFHKGHHYEDLAREKYERLVGFNIPPQVVKCALRPYMQASLDCFNGKHDFVGEVKFQGKDDWLLLREKGIVPECYYPQVQYQLACTDFKELHFIGINQQKDVGWTIVKPDLNYINKMIAWCDKFWELIQENIAPSPSQQDYKKFSRKIGVEKAERIFEIDQTIKDLMMERVALQDDVLSVAKSTRMIFNDKILINVSHFDKKDDLRAIKELEDLNVEDLGRSVKDDLKLIIIKNTNKDIKGANNVKKANKQKDIQES